MKLEEVLHLCGNNYNQYVQFFWVGGRNQGKRSAIMKKGNITFKKIDQFGYGYNVGHIFPIFKQNKRILFIELLEEKET